MPDARLIAGLLLVLGPVLGMVPVAHPALIPVWSASRDRHLAIVAAHRRAWWALNAGFGIATVATAAGVAILPLLAGPRDGDRGAAVLVIPAVAYLTGGVLWCCVLAIRSLVTPTLGDLVAAGTVTEPAETLTGAAQRGLFSGFVLLSGLALVVLGAALLAADVVAGPVALLQVVAGLGILGWLVVARDVIPAVIYLPTILLGVALLWR